LPRVPPPALCVAVRQSARRGRHAPRAGSAGDNTHRSNRVLEDCVHRVEPIDPALPLLGLLLHTAPHSSSRTHARVAPLQQGRAKRPSRPEAGGRGSAGAARGGCRSAAGLSACDHPAGGRARRRPPGGGCPLVRLHPAERGAPAAADHRPLVRLHRSSDYTPALSAARRHSARRRGTPRPTKRARRRTRPRSATLCSARAPPCSLLRVASVCERRAAEGRNTIPWRSWVFRSPALLPQNSFFPLFIAIPAACHALKQERCRAGGSAADSARRHQAAALAGSAARGLQHVGGEDAQVSAAAHGRPAGAARACWRACAARAGGASRGRRARGDRLADAGAASRARARAGRSRERV